MTCTPVLTFPCSPNGNPGGDPDLADSAGTDSLFFVDDATGKVMAHTPHNGDNVRYHLPRKAGLAGTPRRGRNGGARTRRYWGHGGVVHEDVLRVDRVEIAGFDGFQFSGLLWRMSPGSVARS